MYKVRVTTIEKFRRFMVCASERDNEAELIEAIKGTFEGNEMTMIGSAYHKIMEGEAAMLGNGLIADNIFFTAEQAEPALEFRFAHPHMIHEIAVQKVYETHYGPVLVTGRVDGQEGKETEDKKCVFRFPDLQGYIDSYQWRFYLDILQTDIFFYDLFEFRGFTKLEGWPHFLHGVTIHPHDRLQCVRYPMMGLDCLSMLNDFLDFVEARNLWGLLKQVAEPVGKC